MFDSREQWSVVRISITCRLCVGFREDGMLSYRWCPISQGPETPIFFLRTKLVTGVIWKRTTVHDISHYLRMSTVAAHTLVETEPETSNGSSATRVGDVLSHPWFRGNPLKEFGNYLSRLLNQLGGRTMRVRRWLERTVAGHFSLLYYYFLAAVSAGGRKQEISLFGDWLVASVAGRMACTLRRLL